MAKSKRSSHRVQATRQQVARARYAVKHGLISPRAKITKNTLSRNVANKLIDLKKLGALPSYGYNEATRKLNITEQPQRVPVRVHSPQKFKDQGYSVFGNYIVTSKPKEVKKNIQSGGMGGSTLFKEKGPAGVRYGAIERISLSRNGIRNFADLRNALRDNKLDPKVKHKDDMYSFLYFGQPANPSRKVEHKFIHPQGVTAEFLDGEDLLAYLQRYQAVMNDDSEESRDGFKHFDLIRVNYEMDIRHNRRMNEPAPKKNHHSRREIADRNRQRRIKTMQQADKLTQAEAKRQQRERETPAQTEMRKARDAERHRRNRELGRYK